MSSNENFITLRDNGVRYGQFPKKQLKFMQKALKINEEEQRAFCVGDFHELTPENFRQYIFKLGNYIEIVTPSYPKFYKIKGVNMMANNFRKLSGIVLGDNVLSMLNKLPRQQIIVKDLEMHVEIKPELFYGLVSLATKSVDSKEILCKQLQYDSEILSTVKITPELIQILLEAKKQPIVYDMYGILKITKILGIFEGIIRSRFSETIPLPSIGDWKCVSYRLGLDGQYRYDKPEDCVTWKDFAGGILRKYSEMGGKSDIDMSIDTRL